MSSPASSSLVAAGTSAPAVADRVLVADWVLTMDGSGGPSDPGLLSDGAVAIQGDLIAAVGPSEEIRSAFPDAVVERLAGHVLLPGLVNAHTHLAMTMFRGIADDRPLSGFLDTVVPLEARMLDPDVVRAASRAALVESHRAGITTSLDMYFFADVVLDAAEEVGARVLTGPVLLDAPGPDLPSGSWQERLASAERWLEAHPARADWSPVLGPHSAYAVGADHLAAAADLAHGFDALVHIHAAETEFEVATVLETHGARPVELLDEVGLLGERCVVAHGVHLSERERALLAERGASVVHCPASNMKLASGVAPVPDLMGWGVDVALGTDGAASSNDLDVLQAARLAALLHKVTAPQVGEGVAPQVGGVTAPRADGASLLPAPIVLLMATRGGARALGLDGRLGVLRAGAFADIVAIDLDRPHTQPVHDVCSAIVYAAGRGDVTQVWSRGRRVVQDCWHQLVSERVVSDDLRALGARVRDAVRPQR